MSLENITGKIKAEADGYAAAVIAEAEAEAKTVTEEYESAAERDYKQIIDAAYEKAGEIQHRSNTQSMKEKRINILSAKWEYLDNAFSMAVKILCKLPDGEQIKFLTDLILKYQRSDGELIFNKADRERIGQTITSHVNNVSSGFKTTLSERTEDFSGGLILKEGGVETNLTYEALVSSRREQLEDEVSSILFGRD